MADEPRRLADLTPQQQHQLLAQLLARRAAPAPRPRPPQARARLRARPYRSPSSASGPEPIGAGPPLVQQRLRPAPSGPLDVAALGASLDAIVRRHAILRTTFPVVAGSRSR